MKVGLICCGRLENRYAVEFVDHYKQLGFNHIFIADNNRSGEEHFEDVLQSYIDEGFVTIYDYRHIEYEVQFTAYIELYYKLSNDYDWFAFFDFDEFLILQKDKTIHDYLSRICFKRYNQILINWKVYTDNDLVYDDGRSCLERFTTPLKENTRIREYNQEINKLTKCIIKTKIKDLDQFTVHNFYNKILYKTTCNNFGHYIDNFLYQKYNYDLAYIKHFPTKTISEYVNNKLKRGTGDRTIEKFNDTYTIHRFFEINKITKEKLDFLEKNKIKFNYF